MSTLYNAFEYDVLIKAVVIGNHAVGKSSLLKRYSDGVFEHGMKPTIGVDCAWRTFEQDDGRVVKVQLWDTSGSERFRGITASYYRGTHCALVVYDVTDRNSFESIPGWLKDLEKNGTADSAILILVANKCDGENERVVSSEEGRELAERNGIAYVETSALTSEGVEEAFQSAVDAAIPIRLQQQEAARAREDSGKDFLFLSNRPVRSMTCMQRMSKWLGWSS